MAGRASERAIRGRLAFVNSAQEVVAVASSSRGGTGAGRDAATHFAGYDQRCAPVMPGSAPYLAVAGGLRAPQLLLHHQRSSSSTDPTARSFFLRRGLPLASRHGRRRGYEYERAGGHPWRWDSDFAARNDAERCRATRLLRRERASARCGPRRLLFSLRMRAPTGPCGASTGHAGAPSEASKVVSEPASEREHATQTHEKH